jgi:hypothetical protein
MKRFYFCLALIALLAYGTSCVKDTPPVPPVPPSLFLHVKPNVKGQTFDLNKYYQGSSQEYNLSLFRAYLSDIRLVKDDGSETQVKDVLLIDLGYNPATPGDPNTVGKEFNFNIPAGNYKAIKMGLGVNKPLNEVKMNYPNDHALSIYRGTDWSWAGYRFIMLEGNAKNQSGVSEPFEYHTAMDSFYREMSFDKSFTAVEGGGVSLNIMIDVDKIFNPADQSRKIDLVTEDFTHTEEASAEQMDLTRRITENLKDAISIE